jgi:hypothetical protein
MGQRNEFEGTAVVVQSKRSPDDFVELLESKELGDGEFADGNDQLWLEESDLVVHPGRTIPDLIRSRDAIAARRGFPGETAAHGREINLPANLFLTQLAELLEPTEERAPRGPRERFAQDRFFHSGRLTDEHHFAQDRSAGNGRRQHSRTAAALEQKRDMSVEQLLFS